MKLKLDGSINLGKIVKICIAITAMLVIVGFAVGATRVYQVQKERKEIQAINNSLQTKGLTDEAKTLAGKFALEYPKTQNIVITDKEDNIIYSANYNLIEGLVKFVIEPDKTKRGVLNLKDTQTKFFGSPMMIRMLDNTQNGQMQPYRTGKMGMQNNRNEYGGMMRNREIPMRDTKGPETWGNFGKEPLMMKYHKEATFNKAPNMLFLDAYKVNDNINIYYVSQAFRENILSGIMVVTGMLLKLLALIFWVLIAVWIYRDSKQRRLNSVFWGIFGVITGIFGLIIYFIYKHWIAFCSVCKVKVAKDANYCDNCGNYLQSKCSSCGEIVSTKDNYCIKCGTKLEKK